MRLLGVALVLVVTAACSPSAGPEPSPPALPRSLAPGSTWLLVGPSTVTGDVTLTFADGQASGKAPVNTYSAPVTATADGSIDIGPVTSTEMGGSPEAMTSEQEYYALLDRAQQFDSDDVQLTLRDGDETLLRFAAPGSPAVFGRTLVGMPVKKARAAAQDEGYAFRVISVDGKSKAITMDYNPQRLNAAVVDGLVTEVTVG